MIPFEFLEKDDITQTVKRIRAKILIDKGQSKENVKEVINYAVDFLKNDSFCKPITFKRFGTKKYEAVFLFIYDSMRQYNYGLPICRAQWIDDDCQVKPNEFDHDDEIGDHIIIDWQDENDFMDDFIKENQMEIREYIKSCENIFEQYEELFHEVFNVIEKTEKDFYQALTEFETPLSQLYVIDLGFPKSDDPLYQKMRLAEKGAIGYLHDVVLNSKDSSSGTFKFIAKTNLNDSTKSAYEYKQLMKEIKRKYQ